MTHQPKRRRGYRHAATAYAGSFESGVSMLRDGAIPYDHNASGTHEPLNRRSIDRHLREVGNLS
jgi:hypothetical protein